MTHKIYLDCTHTYNSGLNTGIQRVVKNVVKNLQEVKEELNVDVIPVILKKHRYYKFHDFHQVNQNNNHIKNILKKIYIKIRSSIAFILPKKVHKLLYSPIISIYLSKLTDEMLFSKKINNDNEVILKSNDTLVLIDTTWFNNNYKLLDSLKKNNIKIVAVIYDIIPITHPEFCTIDLTNSLKDWYENAVPYIDGFVAISKSVRDDTYKYIKENIDPNIRYEKFDYFYLGVDFTKSDDSKDLPQRFKQLFEDSNIYLTVSTIEPRKNHSYILDAFELLWENGEDVKYIMIGRVGWNSDDLINRVKSHKYYNEKLFLLTDIDDNGLIYAYQNSKALIFASYIEGFGLPIIESLYYNLPVFASNIPIHKEIGRDNVLYFDLSNPQSLINLIINKRDELESTNNFLWQNWHQSTKELILKVGKF